MQFAFLKDWKTAAQRLCCERELLGVAASVGIHERLCCERELLGVAASVGMRLRLLCLTLRNRVFTLRAARRQTMNNGLRL